MKFHTAIEEIGPAGALQIAMTYCQNNDHIWTDSINTIFGIVSNDISLAPRNIGSKNDDAISAIGKWIEKYFVGFTNRPSNRNSALPGTVPDPIIDTIILQRLPNLAAVDIEKIKYAHRLSMSAENILGLFLEEYLANELREFGWHCAWGDIVRSVDFVRIRGTPYFTKCKMKN